MYISLIGPRRTKMTKSANTILQCYYMTQRKSQYRDPSRTTVRMLDSLIRLSQAHCRLMYRTTILPIDAIFAISLVDLSMQDCTLEDTVDALHSTFLKHPDFDYLCTAKKLLTKLNLIDIWKEELFYYGKLLQVDHKTLENDVEKENHKLFAKFDDVSDDNIPLTASLVTSSYFNNKKNVNKANEKNDKVPDYIQEANVMNKKLAATLKKHASLNKIHTNPATLQKKSTKRKRKEVLLDTSKFGNKKQRKKKQTKPDTSDSDECDVKKLLNAVPSVNDVFTDLGIDVKLCDNESFNNSSYNSEKNVTDHSNINKENIIESNKTFSNSSHGSDTTITFNADMELSVVNKENKVKSCIPLNNSRDTSDETVGNEPVKENHVLNKENKIESSVNNPTKHENNEVSEKLLNKSLSKLKQFQFAGKRDLSKFYEEHLESNKDATDPIVKLVTLDNIKDASSHNSFENPKKSVPSSQISMFESSDCEIDLDM